MWQVLYSFDIFPTFKDTKNDSHVAGIQSTYFYLSSGPTMFETHKEDFRLYSTNALQLGAAKLWCVLDPEDSDKFESFIMAELGLMPPFCAQFIRHQRIVVLPSVLRDKGIRYQMRVQLPGCWVTVSGDSYHFGMNLGPNLAEAINWAPEGYIPSPTYLACDHRQNSLCPEYAITYDKMRLGDYRELDVDTSFENESPRKAAKRKTEKKAERSTVLPESGAHFTQQAGKVAAEDLAASSGLEYKSDRIAKSSKRLETAESRESFNSWLHETADDRIRESYAYYTTHGYDHGSLALAIGLAGRLGGETSGVRYLTKFDPGDFAIDAVGKDEPPSLAALCRYAERFRARKKGEAHFQILELFVAYWFAEVFNSECLVIKRRLEEENETKLRRRHRAKAADARAEKPVYENIKSCAIDRITAELMGQPESEIAKNRKHKEVAAKRSLVADLQRMGAKIVKLSHRLESEGLKKYSWLLIPMEKTRLFWSAKNSVCPQE